MSTTEERVFKRNSLTLTADEEKVVVDLGYATKIYYATKAPREYMMWLMVFNEGDKEVSQDDFVEAMVGIETLPMYALQDTELATKLLEMVTAHILHALDNIKARGDSQEELDEDAMALIDLKLQELIAAGITK